MKASKQSTVVGAASATDPHQSALEAYGGALGASHLMAKAEAVTGLRDWGGPRWGEDRFRHDLDILCDGIEAGGDVTGLHRSRTHSRLFTMLVSRLRYLDARKSSAGLNDQRIVAPLIGTGLPRAGTTFLHGLLSKDPANRFARAYEAAMPGPLDMAGSDAREEIYREILRYQGMLDPALSQIHPFASEAPEECIFLQEGDCGALYNVYWTVPGYQAATADKMQSAFRWQVGVMQYLQAGRPGGRWALKAPGHLFSWNEMRMAFPDALIYVNHRDPGKVVPSIASFMVALHGLFSDTPLDPLQMGAAQIGAWAYAMNGYRQWRSEEGADANVFDVQFFDLTARPIETVAALYDRFAIPFSDVARGAMLRHIEVDHHGKGPGRSYTLAEFGLDVARIEESFGDYIDQFGIERERRS